jgi:hypothetical protein
MPPNIFKKKSGRLELESRSSTCLLLRRVGFARACQRAPDSRPTARRRRDAAARARPVREGCIFAARVHLRVTARTGRLLSRFGFGLKAGGPSRPDPVCAPVLRCKPRPPPPGRLFSRGAASINPTRLPDLNARLHRALACALVPQVHATHHLGESLRPVASRWLLLAAAIGRPT